MEASEWEILLGPPGTGKTQSLIRVVEELLADGLHPTKIAYLAFTRRAAKEARERAQAKFLFTDAEMPWYRTIHSLAFKQIGARSDAVMMKSDYSEVAGRAGFAFAGQQLDTDEELFEVETCDGLIFLENLARIRMTLLEDLWPLLGDRIHAQYNIDDVQILRRTLNNYKEATGKIDFTDFLEKFNATGVVPPVEVVIIDEAQDLSRLQWEAIKRITPRATRVIVAGDSDQAIYRWAGADVAYFQAVSKTGRARILDQSHRVPKQVWGLSQDIIHRIKDRVEQPYKPKEDRGSVEMIYADYDLDASKGSWLFLCRHTHQLRGLKSTCRSGGWFFECREKASNQTEAALAVIAWENLRRGAAVRVREAFSALWYAEEDKAIETLKNEFSHPEEFITRSSITELTGVALTEPWAGPDGLRLIRITEEEAEYFTVARRSGEVMAKVDEDNILRPVTPRIRISTIHGSKGAQAKGVYLLTDLSESAYQSLEVEDDEHRTFYVAVTRAEDRLVIRRPLEARYYEMPETF